jgi:uncharacterized protein (DUF2236 family)
MDSIIRMPQSLRRSLDAAVLQFLNPDSALRVDFSAPRGEPALIGADSVSWRVFKNPVALWIGGVAAVILELAEPAVRATIWRHSSFRQDPVGRLRRTGVAAMTTVYGACSVSKPMIARVVRMHAAVAANDARLLTWVQATAAFGFVEAYKRYADPLTQQQTDRFYLEGVPAARLYGALPPDCGAEIGRLFESMLHRLEPSATIFEFLQIMNDSRILPGPLRGIQGMLVRAAVDLVPAAIRQRLGLTASFGLRAWQRPLAQWAGSVANRVVLPRSPSVQACLRLGYPADYLYG